MSSPKSAPPLKVELRPSRWLASLILFAHGGALVVLVPLALPIWALAPLVGLITGSLVYTLKTHALLRGPLTIRRVIWDSDNDWLLHAASGEQLAGRLLPGSYVHPLLVILNFELETPPSGTLGGRQFNAKRRSIVLAKDSTDATTLRQLRARLNFFRPQK